MAINLFDVDWDDPAQVAALRSEVDVEAEEREDPDWDQEHSDAHWAAAPAQLGAHLD